MKLFQVTLLALLKSLALLAWLSLNVSPAHAQRDGSRERPLSVLLIPADGGTEDGTKADFKPLFDALTRSTGLHFEIKTGQSYSAVIEGMCAGLADIAWFGPTSYLAARDRDCAELLAVEVRGGSSTYFSALFVAEGSGIRTVADMKGHSIALGSSHSASSFVYPLAMIAKAGLDPVSDLSAIRISDSHSSSLVALSSGMVDVAGASFISFERALNQGAIAPGSVRILARSDPIPNPPLALRPGLPAPLKQRLRKGLSDVHVAPGVKPEMIRGYGGKVVDRYDVTVTDAVFNTAVRSVAFIDEPYVARVLRKAGNNK